MKTIYKRGFNYFSHKYFSQICDRHLLRFVHTFFPDVLHFNKYLRELKATKFTYFSRYDKIPAFCRLYYGMVRHYQPRVVLETGVNCGNSTTFVLYGMHKNGFGELHSIDLPGTSEKPIQDKKPSGDYVRYHLESEEMVGFKVPEFLRERWHLYLGDSKELLPRVLKTIGKVDIFIHDSLHTYAHMMMEFQTVYEYLTSGGLILADDVDWNNAFTIFCNQQGLRHAIVDRKIFRNKRMPKKHVHIVGVAQKT